MNIFPFWCLIVGFKVCAINLITGTTFFSWLFEFSLLTVFKTLNLFFSMACIYISLKREPLGVIYVKLANGLVA